MSPAAASRGRSASSGHLSIGQVLARLTPEFPHLSASKLRYFEEQGLVAPLRNGLQALGLLPNNAVAVQCTLFRKTPECNWKVPYHQDLSIPVTGRVAHAALSGWSIKEDGWYVQPPVELLDRLLAARLHLDPCGDDDGALRVVPETHRLGRINPERIAAMDKRRDEVVCSAEPGDLLLMRPLLLHASSKAERPNGRRVLHFLFAPPDPGCGLQWRIAV